MINRMSERRKISIIDNAEKLKAFLASVVSETQIGVDMEADSLHHYRDRVCLIQVSTRSTDAIIDPLINTSLTGLWTLFENASFTKIFHDADFDLRSLNRDFGICVKNIFDTKVTMDLLGETDVGLASVLKRYFNVNLRKKFQRYNWSRRPLSREAIEYAAIDTRYLIRLKTILEERLRITGRMEWAREEFEHLESLRWQPGKRETKGFWKFVSKNNHHPQFLECLRLLWNMRESEAERHDRPVFQIFPDHILSALAEFSKNTQDQPRLEALLKYVPESIRGDITQITKTVKNTSVDQCPVIPDDYFAGNPTYNKSLYMALKICRDQAAAHQEMDPGIIAGNKSLKKIATMPEKSLENYTKVRQAIGLRRWQWALLMEHFKNR
jgi:ribonuclease D